MADVWTVARGGLVVSLCPADVVPAWPVAVWFGLGVGGLLL